MKHIFQFKSIRMKVLTGFLAVVVLVMVMVLLTHLGFKRLNGETEEIVERQLKLLTLDQELVQNMTETKALIRAYVIYGTDEYKSKVDDYLAEGREIDSRMEAASVSEKAIDLLETKHEWAALVEQTAEQIEKKQKKDACFCQHKIEPERSLQN